MQRKTSDNIMKAAKRAISQQMKYVKASPKNNEVFGLVTFTI